ncbi:hypothetical protein TTHERM_00947590 (macronuclear) [Tetrahymena thermophila SB210]|uniref:Tetratricopeptide repeat protein n=1 Tax=Tetrahymena thermophila (strain SB210) TaxID=312017 RepID=I7MF80_TETTS|nr:hypothetical protein TTHERM_00947590 [Tetrahymena thermophila SB210]EAR83332.1 hypothetical protein TTHERM_00947590 [Tetrahymena thermophila SB210]|eukprot:XP_001030995.1 hypothetical protein TTHERM_00947590 [Tetrahymena thermophila SB210]
MLKKPLKKQNKIIDNEKEPELINKISPRRKEQFENHHKDGNSQQSQKNSLDNTQNQTQGKGGGSSQNRNNLEEIVKLLQKPIIFQITFTNKLQQSKIPQQQIQQSQKLSNQQQSNLLSGNNYKLSQNLVSNQNSNSNSNSNNFQSISESDIPKYIEQCIETGLKYLEQNNLKESIQQFRNAEVLIDTYMQQEGKVSTDLMLAVVINLGICFYKAGLFDEAYSCFENSDMRMKKKIAEKAASLTQSNKNNKNPESKYSASAGKSFQSNQQFTDSNGLPVPNTIGGCISEAAFISSFSKTLKEGSQINQNGFTSQGIEDVLTYFSNLGNKLKRKKLRLSLNLQMCILFSEIGKHEDALDYAKKSSKIAIHILYDCLCICYFILIRGNMLSANQAVLHTENSAVNSSSVAKSQTLTEPSSESTLSLSQKVLLQFEKLNRSSNNSTVQSQAQQQQLIINNNSLNNSHRRIRSEYGNNNVTQNKTTSQSNQRNSSSSCDNNQIASPVVKQRSGSTKGRLLTPTNPLEKKLSSSSAYSNSHLSNNTMSGSSKGLKQCSSIYGNLLSESSDAPIFSQEEVNLAFKCLPIFHYITNNFGALRDNFNEKFDKKVKLALYMRQIYEELISSKEVDPKKRLSFILSPSQLDMHFINSTIKENHWLLTSNILNLLQMKPVSLSTISQFTPTFNEIIVESSLRKIVESAICFYCISTETRFIEESSFLQNPNLSYKISDSEFWLGKSLEIAYTLIPQDAPMISQIINVYTRFHGVDKQIIPEEEEFPDQVKLLKPQKGVNITASSSIALKNNFFIPAIRTTIPKNHAQDLYIFYHSQPHAGENLELYSSDRKSKESPQGTENIEKKQKHFEKDIQFQNIAKKVQIPKSIEDQMLQHEQQLIEQFSQQNNITQPNNNVIISNQQNISGGDSLLQEGSNILTPLTQESTHSQTMSATQQSLTLNGSISQKGQQSETLQKQQEQFQENQQNKQIKTHHVQQVHPGINNSSQSDALQYFNQQNLKQQNLLKAEEQYLNQQKYQQAQYLFENKTRSLSRDKKQSTGQSNPSNSSANSNSIKDQQQILDKIEEIVKKQRPQSSSIHSSSTQAGSQNLNNINQSNIFGTSTNIKKSQFNSSSNNNNQAQNNLISDMSNQICYSEPSNSSSNNKNNNKIKVQNIMNSNNNHGIISEQGVSKSQGRNIHTSPPQHQQQQNNLQINNVGGQTNNNFQQIFIIQQQLLNQAKAKRNNQQLTNNSNQLNAQNNTNSSAQNQQKQQGHNFLKSFNQFLKQNRLQDDRKQTEPKKPSAANNNNNNNNNNTQNGNQIQQNPNMTLSYFQQQNQQQNINYTQQQNPLNLTDKITAKKVMKQNFFENHRPSLPEQFGLSNISQQIPTSQSTKNSTNSNNLTGSTNFGNGSLQKSFNYSLLKPQQQNPTEFANQNGAKNNQFNNENVMPIRHSSEPHNALKVQGQNSNNQSLNNSKQQDNNYLFSVLLNQQQGRQNSQEKEAAAQLREKKLNSFKQGEIQINTNLIYLPSTISGGSSTTAAHTNISTTENSLLPQENFLKQIEMNNYSLKNSQKRNNSAGNKNSQNANQNFNTNSNLNQLVSSNQYIQENQPLINNFIPNNSNFNSSLQQSFNGQHILQNIGSISSSNQQYQQNLSASLTQQSNSKQQQVLTQSSINQQLASTVIQNNIVFQQPALEQKSQKVNSRQLHKRKMVSNNIQFNNEKFNLISVKSPSNFSTLQSPTNNFQSIPSTTKSNFAKISMPNSTQVQTKIQFPQSSQVGQASASSSQQRKDSVHRKRRIKTDSYDSGAFNSFDIDNKLRNSYERAHSNQQNARLKTQN